MVMLMMLVLAAAAAITLEGIVIMLELGDCRKGRLPVDSRASVPLDGER